VCKGWEIEKKEIGVHTTEGARTLLGGSGGDVRDRRMDTRLGDAEIVNSAREIWEDDALGLMHYIRFWRGISWEGGCGRTAIVGWERRLAGMGIRG
jgi:hypothetical protein